MNAITFDAFVHTVLLTAVFIGSMYAAGRIARRRGRSFKNWAAVAGVIGPLALPLLFLLPNLHGRTASMAGPGA